MTQAAADATTAGQLLPFKAGSKEGRKEGKGREGGGEDGEWEAAKEKAEKSCAISRRAPSGLSPFTACSVIPSTSI